MATVPTCPDKLAGGHKGLGGTRQGEDEEGETISLLSKSRDTHHYPHLAGGEKIDPSDWGWHPKLLC